MRLSTWSLRAILPEVRPPGSDAAGQPHDICVFDTQPSNAGSISWTDEYDAARSIVQSLSDLSATRRIEHGPLQAVWLSLSASALCIQSRFHRRIRSACRAVSVVWTARIFRRTGISCDEPSAQSQSFPLRHRSGDWYPFPDRRSGALFA